MVSAKLVWIHGNPGIMGMTGWCDLLMYVPHIIIIGLTIFIATRQLAYENKSDTQNENGNI